MSEMLLRLCAFEVYLTMSDCMIALFHLWENFSNYGPCFSVPGAEIIFFPDAQFTKCFILLSFLSISIILSKQLYIVIQILLKQLVSLPLMFAYEYVIGLIGCHSKSLLWIVIHQEFITINGQWESYQSSMKNCKMEALDLFCFALEFCFPNLGFIYKMIDMCSREKCILC